MRAAAWPGAGVIFFAVFLAPLGCAPTQTVGSSGASSSGGGGSSAGSSVGTSGGNGSGVGTSGTSGGQTTGGPDPCFGVTCTASGAACYGGECKCGGPDGVLCSAPGESCSPIDNSCVPTATGCAITSCPTNYVCNPQDSTCHCGSESGPACKEGGNCILSFVDGGILMPGEDAGGAAVYGVCSYDNDPCHGVVCPPFEVCDENDNGACECGGAPEMNIPGTVCAADESCVDPSDGGAPTCTPN